MAKIEKMLISGIRSYPPDGNSVIEFQNPLTLIVGANGTGKTVSKHSSTTWSMFFKSGVIP